MLFGEEERKETILTRIESLRAAAAFCGRLKPVVSSFDGKQYNRRFDEAIQALNDTENRVYVSNHYGRIYIYFVAKNTGVQDLYLMSGYSCKSQDFIKNQTVEKEIFFDGKKIKATAMIENINMRRERLLKEAYELETAFNDLDEIIKRLDALKRAWENITGSVPYFLLDTYNIKRYA